MKAYDLESEQLILASIMLDSKLLADARSKLSTDDFVIEKHRLLFEIFCGIVDHKDQLEPTIIVRELEKNHKLELAGGKGYLFDLAELAVTTTTIDYHISALKDHNGKFRLFELASRIEKAVSNNTGVADIVEDIKDTVLTLSGFSKASEGNLAQQVREWLLSSNAVFSSLDIVKDLSLVSSGLRKNLSKILARLVEEKVIERYGERNGMWRKIDRSVVEQCWWQTEGLPLPIEFPLDVHLFAKIYPGNVILLEGQKSQGKSAFALEFCRLNRRLFGNKILYQNVEMSDDEFLERFKNYGDLISLQDWKESLTIIKQHDSWWDKILPDAINVVDYLLEYKEAYLIPDYIWKIHQKLRQGIALVLLQRDPLKPYPHGGRAARDIPRLIISLIRHKIRIEDVKSWHQTEYGNPNGLVRDYKQVSWWNFKPMGGWSHEEETKYKQFS